MIASLLLACGIIALIGQTTLILLWCYPRIQHNKKTAQTYYPSVAVIVPCKGIDEHFQETIHALCTQDYPFFRVIFIVDSTQDSAYPVLYQLQSAYHNMTIEISDCLTSCSGKIAAQLKGISVAGAAEVFVFADADIQPHAKWLHYLIQPLQDENVGATTGFRWYFPEKKTTALISTWNMLTMAGLFYQITTYTWGGSTAIRKTTFEKLDVAHKWRNGLSDDLILTTLLKHNKYAIMFVPQSIVESHAEENISSFIRWASRQMTWVKWYYSSLWFFSFFLFLSVEILILLSILLLVTGNILLGLLLGSLIVFQMIYGYTGFTTLRKLMCYPKKRFRSAVLPAVLSPIVYILLLYTMVVSSLKREILWCGRIYKKSDLKRLKRNTMNK